MDFIKILSLFSFLSIVCVVHPSVAQDNRFINISKIQYTEKEIHELSEIPLSGSTTKQHANQFESKVDELIELLEMNKKAVEQGQDIDLLQETVNEINKLLEQKKTGPAKISVNDFHTSICFQCHGINDFKPSDKTQKQWLRLIENDGHTIFETISWESPYQKKQILEFLLKMQGHIVPKESGSGTDLLVENF